MIARTHLTGGADIVAGKVATMNNRAATIADIGRELGLSPMTVSRALNGSPDVNEETRRRVISQAERLNFPAARNTRLERFSGRLCRQEQGGTP